jgi:hypothetical protein
MSDFDYSDRTKDIFKGDITRDFSADITGYESPITGYIRRTIEDLNEARDEAIVSTIREQYAIDCNREELIKALAYDRDQYNKGYEAGYKRAKQEFERPQGEWIICHRDNEGIHKIKCPFCKYTKGTDFGGLLTLTFECLPPFCEKCGADMRMGE